MDPLTIASTLATLAELLGVWKDERRNRQDVGSETIDDYLEWLRRHDHQQLVDLVSNNLELSQSLEEMMQGQHTALMAKLAEIGKAIGDVSIQVSALSSEGDGSHHTGELSPQAISILQQMVASNASQLYEMKLLATGRHFELLGSSGNRSGQVKLAEPQFVDDDLEKLCELRFLTLSHTSRGDRKFRLTRAGAAVGGSIEKNTENKFTQFINGLDDTELWVLAKAVIQQTQTIACGSGDRFAATLTSKGLLEKVPFDPPYKKAMIPYTIPSDAWKYLNENKKWLLVRTIEVNQRRPDDRLPLLNDALQKMQ